jgi:hypothetical protein
MKKIIISLVVSIFFFSNCAKEDENDPDNASVSLSDNATTFSVTVSSGKYHLDGPSNPSLKLKRGYVYYFDATDSSTNTHPLLLSSSSSGGNTSGEYTNGVTNSQTTNGTLTFQVPSDAPSTLYYVCAYHSGMGGEITISD